MNDKRKFLKAAVSSAMAIGFVTVSSAALAGKPGMEKCMGISKAGKNDCGTSQHACAGMSKVDGQADEWLFVPTGTCAKIPGGKVKVAKKG